MGMFESDRLAVAKMQKMDKDLQEGKRKLISKEKALGKYAKLLKQAGAKE
jgi:hypothetical protein